MRTVHFITFGCQMNKLDSELARETLIDAGYAVTDSEQDADTIIFNTCAVRDHAEQRVVSRLAQLAPRRQDEPNLRLGMMGCFAERHGAALLRDLPYLDFAVGTRQFPYLPDILAELDDPEEKPSRFGPNPTPSPGIDQAHSRHLHSGIQGFVSVMRGCNNRCSYCIVPDVRGEEISRPPEAIAQEVAALAKAGAREVTLLGQNVDAYGKDTDVNLARLLRLIDKEAPQETGLLRIRFVTSHPRDITRELVETVAELERVCPHFHMPAQSGSDRILSAMRRGYTREEYDGKVAMIREVLPDAGILSDFIVGFPGETEEDYLATRDLVERSLFQNSFIFKYSPRPGTVSAETMADDVSVEEKKRRNNDLLGVQNRVNATRGSEMIGRELGVLVEGESSRDSRRWVGRSGENYICVFPAPPKGEDWTGKLIQVRVDAATALTLYCALM